MANAPVYGVEDRRTLRLLVEQARDEAGRILVRQAKGDRLSRASGGVQDAVVAAVVGAMTLKERMRWLNERQPLRRR
jgi:hypothetical protein